MDVVARQQSVGSRQGVVRSAFQITNNDENFALSFDSYFFADRDPMVLPGPYIQYRAKTIESSEELESLLSTIRRTYTLYNRGQRPDSINPEDWLLITRRRREALGLN